MNIKVFENSDFLAVRVDKIHITENDLAFKILKLIFNEFIKKEHYLHEF